MIQKTIDDVKRYWDDRPCNVRHSKKEIGTREYFNEVERKRYFVEQHNPVFASFESWSGRNVLEIGCGIGTDTINFARAGATIVAIDISRKSIEIAKERARMFGLEDKISFYNCSAEDMGGFVSENLKFDLIYSFGVIHHTPNPAAVIAQFNDLLAADGEVRVMLYHKLSWKVFKILMTYGKGMFWKLDQLIAEHSEAQQGCPVTYAYTRPQGKKLFEQHGLRVSQMFVRHIFPWRVVDYVRGIYRKVWYWHLVPSSLFNILQRNIGWHLCIIAHTDKSHPQHSKTLT